MANYTSYAGVTSGPLVDASAVSTGADQILLSQNLGRRYLLIQNNTTAPMSVNFGTGVADTTTAHPSIQVPGFGGYLEYTTFVPTDEVHAFATVTNQVITVKVG